MRKVFIIKVELDDWSAEELVKSLKNQMPFSTENCSTIQVEEIIPNPFIGCSVYSVPTILKDYSTFNED